MSCRLVQYLKEVPTTTTEAVDGAFLKYLREANGWTTKTFAEALGISEDYLRNIEGGHRLLKRRPDLIKKASEVLGVPQQKLKKAA